MSIYKVVLEKTSFVAAESEDEAREKALDDDFIMSDEEIRSIRRSKRGEVARKAFRGGAENDR